MGRPALSLPESIEDENLQICDYYRQTIASVERLHRLLLDVIKDEFERLGLHDLNSVQALLLFNIAQEEVTAGELKSRGYYQGSNVSYNLKKLVEKGYLHHERCEMDRRSVRIRLTDKGHEMRRVVMDLHTRHAAEFAALDGSPDHAFQELSDKMRRLEKFWRERIRYLY